MKQLFQLVVKYIRRQRFRTTLTFLCVLLSVFVFNLLCDAFVVIRGVAISSVTQYQGTWEADLSALVNQTEDKKKAIETIKNSLAVEDYLHHETASVGNYNISRDPEGYLYYLEYTVNDSKPMRAASANQTYLDGHLEVLGDRIFFGNVSNEAAMKGGIVVPDTLKKEGYQIGDTVTVSLTAKRAKFSDEQPALKEVQEKGIKRVQEDNGADVKYRLYSDSPGTGLPDEEEDVRTITIYGGSLFSSAMMRGKVNELIAEDEHSGEAYSFTLPIIGFSSDQHGINVYADFDTVDVAKCLNGEFSPEEQSKNAAQFAQAEAYAVYDGDSDEMHYGMQSGHSQGIDIITNQNMDFDDAMEGLYQELGLPEEDMDELLHPLTPYGGGVQYNENLLMLRFRGSDSYAKWFDSMDTLVALVVFAVVALLVWALMRFVIDNAFEISVQERSAQFATLRIMGASRKQIGTIVGLEAIFYCLASIPPGMLLSYLCRTSVFNALEEYGFHVQDTSFPALTILAAVLALTAVLVSSYTSSMWAARAYSPLEASKKTKLKGNKKESIWTKNLFSSKPKPDKQEEKAKRKAMPTGDLKAVRHSKLNRKQKSFLRNYSMRNIRRTRSRFVISVISMSLGTILFAFGLTIGISVTWSLQDAFDSAEDLSDFDFMLVEKADDLEEAAAPLLDFANENADRLSMKQSMSFPLYYEQVSDKTIAALSGYIRDVDTDLYRYLNYIPVNEFIYQQEYAPLTGIDYKTFMEQGGVLIDENLCGMFHEWKEDGRGRRRPEKTGREPSYQAINGVQIPLTLHPEYDDSKHPTQKEYPVTVAGLLKRESDNDVTVIVISYDLLKQVFAEEIKNGELPNNCTWVFHFKLKENSDYPVMREKCYELRNQYESQALDDGRYFHFNDNYAESTGMMSLLRTILTIGSIALAAVWLTGIFTMLNTVNTSVLNRADELAMLRMIGMSRKMMKKTVLMESSIYCEFSTLIGGILGISGSLYMMTAMDFFNEQVEMVFVTFGIVLAAIIISNFLISRVAALPSLHTLKRYMDSGRMMQ